MPTESLIGRRGLLLGSLGAIAGVASSTRLGQLVESVAQAAPAVAAVVTTRDEPLGGSRRAPAALGRVLPPRAAPRFTLVGLHWQGDGSVAFRVADDGAWSEWQQAHVHELADPGSGEDRLPGWRLGSPAWTGEASAIQYRLEGDVSRLRAHFVWSPPGPATRAPASAAQPAILPRSAWAADESIVRAAASYADRLRYAVVHHTAGQSPKTPADSAAIIRAIQAYHVESNGWNDIGYNFVVDPFGQVFEARIGGIDRNVIGAHALGYNTGSTGVAVLGNFEKESVTAETITALASLLAWRLDVGHVDPLALVSATSTDGATRTVRAVSGHRDVGSTACPGATLYPQLDALAQQVAATGLPKLYDPIVEPAGDRVFRFTARVSEPRAWTISVASGAGAQVGAATGSGAVDWTWDATTAPDGRYAWTISSDADVRAATGTLTVGVAAPAEPQDVPPPPRPARPGGIPRKIPRWAWDLRAWHRLPKAQRGPRPAGVPRRIPAWYWQWFAWVNAVERWQAAYG